MKNFYIILLSFLFFYISSNSYKIENSDELNDNEAIVFFEMVFLQGVEEFSKLEIKIQSFDEKELIQFDLFANEANHFAFKLKKGVYFFHSLVAHSKFSMLDNSKFSYQGSFFDNAFIVNSKTINYLGRIQMHYYHQKHSKYFNLIPIKKSQTAADNIVSLNKKVYFYSIFDPNNIDWLQKNYNQQFVNYPLLKTTMIYDQQRIQNFFKQEKVLKAESTERYGYLKDNYGIDDNGYQEFKWGYLKADLLEDFNNINEFVEIKFDLNSNLKDKKDYQEKFNIDILPFLDLKKLNNHQNILPVLVHELSEEDQKKSRFQEKRRLFYFSPFLVKEWNEKLYQISLELENCDYNIFMNQLITSYGFSHRKEDYFMWGLPKTMVFFKKQNENKIDNKTCTLHYISRIYYEMMNLSLENF